MDTQILRAIAAATTISMLCFGTMALCVATATVQGTATMTATQAAGTANPNDINWG